MGFQKWALFPNYRTRAQRDAAPSGKLIRKAQIRAVPTISVLPRAAPWRSPLFFGVTHRLASMFWAPFRFSLRGALLRTTVVLQYILTIHIRIQLYLETALSSKLSYSNMPGCGGRMFPKAGNTVCFDSIDLLLGPVPVVGDRLLALRLVLVSFPDVPSPPRPPSGACRPRVCPPLDRPGSANTDPP